MANLSNKPCAGQWEWYKGEKLEIYNSRTDEMLGQLLEESKKVDISKTLVGVILDFGIADGAAWYRVCKDNPLTFEHIPYGDAYRIPFAHIRGLRRQDIIQMVKSRIALDEIMSK